MLKWTGLEEKGGGWVWGLLWNLGPGGVGWSWVFIIMKDHTPPLGGGVQGLWDFARPYPPPCAIRRQKHLVQLEIEGFFPISAHKIKTNRLRQRNIVIFTREFNK